MYFGSLSDAQHVVTWQAKDSPVRFKSPPHRSALHRGRG